MQAPDFSGTWPCSDAHSPVLRDKLLSQSQERHGGSSNGHWRPDGYNKGWFNGLSTCRSESHIWWYLPDITAPILVHAAVLRGRRRLEDEIVMHLWAGARQIEQRCEVLHDYLERARLFQRLRWHHLCRTRTGMPPHVSAPCQLDQLHSNRTTAAARSS